MKLIALEARSGCVLGNQRCHLGLDTSNQPGRDHQPTGPGLTRDACARTPAMMATMPGQGSAEIAESLHEPNSLALNVEMARVDTSMRDT